MIKANKVLENTSWIIACRIIQSLLALVVNMLTARYLGPGNYGTISYAASLVAFAEPLVLLGMNSILVRELLEDPEREGEILGSAMGLSLVSAVVCMAGVTAFARIANAGETETILVCGLYSVILVFKAAELIQYWYQAKLMSKYPSMVMLYAYVVVSAYRIFLLITRRSIYWFSVVNALDCLLIAGTLLALYRRQGGGRLRFSRKRAKQLLLKSRYFILSTMMITVFAQTDKVMLKLMTDEIQTGYYSVAVTCALLSNFVFSAIFDSARPSILESRKLDRARSDRQVTCLFSVIIYLALAQCVAMSLLAEPIIRILYGAQYLPAAAVLRTVVWYTVFSYVGMARSIWILAEQRQQYLWIINLSGALANVALNWLLIPRFGAIGASAASVLTQAFTNVAVVHMIRPIRPSNELMLRGLHPGCLAEMLRNLRKE